MLMHQTSQIEIDLFETLLRTGTDRVVGEEEAVDALRSSVIEGFEKAIDHGVPPMLALAHILDWVSDEMARVKTAPVSVST
ncbi:hypothetical protein [Rhodomicrobium lacus]|jgi:hypothetical protein|uniref:hypothetical protein n=1 Tax=Rhodomicrobium TaxID=1068 RepID=UPI000F8DF3FE|nr:hypothetical protein [Rhodomicrobium lacus]WKW51307.1 hypothetical protein QMO75_02100 [Rhodomicrobium lacus]